MAVIHEAWWLDGTTEGASAFSLSVTRSGSFLTLDLETRRVDLYYERPSQDLGSHTLTAAVRVQGMGNTWRQRAPILPSLCYFVWVPAGSRRPTLRSSLTGPVHRPAAVDLDHDGGSDAGATKAVTGLVVKDGTYVLPLVPAGPPVPEGSKALVPNERPGPAFRDASPAPQAAAVPATPDTRTEEPLNASVGERLVSEDAVRGWFPLQPVDLERVPGTAGALYAVRLRPVCYHTESQKLAAFPRMRVTVELPEESAPRPTRLNLSGRLGRAINQVALSAAIGTASNASPTSGRAAGGLDAPDGHALPTPPPPPPTPPDPPQQHVLVVARRVFKVAAMRLAQAQRGLGRHVTVHWMAEAGASVGQSAPGSAAELQGAIQKAIDAAGRGALSVLLLGAGTGPGALPYAEQGIARTDSDSLWGYDSPRLDSLMLGRIPADDPAAATRIVEAMERAGLPREADDRRVVLGAADGTETDGYPPGVPCADPRTDVGQSSYAHVVRRALASIESAGYTAERVLTWGNDMCGKPPSGLDFRAASAATKALCAGIRRDAALIIYLGHGVTEGLASPRLTLEDIEEDSTPVSRVPGQFCFLACASGAHIDGPGFAAALLRRGDWLSGGIASTRPAGAQTSSHIFEGIAAALARAPQTLGIPAEGIPEQELDTLGGALLLGNLNAVRMIDPTLEYRDNAAVNGSEPWMTLLSTQVFGDPMGRLVARRAEATRP